MQPDEELQYLQAFLSGCKAKDDRAEVKELPQQLVIALGKPTQLKIVEESGSCWYLTPLYETLVVAGEDMKPQPLLATSWERIDELTWKFHLHKGVKFHDGTAFNVQAVKFSLERLQKQGPKWNNLLIKTMQVIDENTILLTTEAPFSPLVESLMIPCASMVSPTAVEKYGNDFDLVSDAAPARNGGADYQLISRFHSTFNPTMQKRTGYRNAKVDDLLEQARCSTDESQRVKMYQEVQKILDQEAATIPLFYEKEAVAVKTVVKGFRPHPAIWPVDLTKVEIKK